MKSKQASRRSVLTGVVVSALAGAAVVNVTAVAEGSKSSRPLNLYPIVYPPAPDPIYRALESYWEAYEQWTTGMAFTDVPRPHPHSASLYEIGRDLNEREKVACDAVIACVPTTAAGLMAYVRFFEHFEAMCEYRLFDCDEDEYAIMVLKTIRTSLEGMEVVA